MFIVYYKSRTDCKMVAIKVEVVLFLMILYESNCSRRIKDGIPVTAEKPYVVYFVKAPQATKKYDGWLCGGALVSSLFIVTSAACVEDVNFVYAIAGFNTYIPDTDLDKHECTKTKKKKVVYTCIPVKYELQYDKLEKWSFIDIALVKVESAYNFKDESYKQVCSYIPQTIAINYEQKYQEANNDAMVLGWGHKETWRKPGDFRNYNQELLHYAPTLILDKEKCIKEYSEFPNMKEVIEQFMICTMDKGNINEMGDHIVLSTHNLQGCGPQSKTRLGPIDPDCEEEQQENKELIIDGTRKQNINKTNESVKKKYFDKNNRNKLNFNDTNEQFRRSGICQNDHGGPLVTWVGAHVVLIGVASVFKVSDTNKCMGPYLYTSTQCNSAFLDCVLSTNVKDDKDKTRRAICDSPPIQRGYDTIERHISWRNHPDGPADSEKLANIKYIDHGNYKENVRNARYPKINKYSNPWVPENGRFGRVEYIGHDNKEIARNEKYSKLKKYSSPIFAVRPQRPLSE